MGRLGGEGREARGGEANAREKIRATRVVLSGPATWGSGGGREAHAFDTDPTTFDAVVASRWKGKQKADGGVAARTYQSSSSSCPCTALPRGGECHPVVVRAREEGWSEDCFLGTLGGGGRRTRRRLNWLSPFKRGGFRTKIHWPGTRACGRGEPPNKPNARVDGACRVPRAVIDPRGVFETRARSRGCVGNREGTRGRVQKKLASAGVQPPFADLRVGPPIFLLAYLVCGQLKWVL